MNSYAKEILGTMFMEYLILATTTLVYVIGIGMYAKKVAQKNHQ
ncbi:hypothetical protein [Sulfurimonas microaerophilic]|nr:hypothetical protein [Sulfurimonas sp. hsl 1-7]